MNPGEGSRNSRDRLASHAYATGRDLSARQHLYDWQTPSYDLPAIALGLLEPAAGTVIDVGCGNGKYLNRIRQKRPDLFSVGVDLSAGILANLAPPLIVADALSLPFAGNSASAILAMHMIYHMADIDAGLNELARVLRPGGLFLASTNASDDKLELDQLWSQAAADILGVAQGPSRISLSSRFPLDSAPAILGRHFRKVQVIELPGVIEVTEPGPVVRHLKSYKAWADQTGTPFDATIDRARGLLTAHIAREGSFKITCRGGILTANGGSY